MVIKVKRQILKSADIRAIAKIFRERLKREGIPVERLFLFGSYAKGTAHKDSDIDFAVVVSPRITRKDARKLKNLPWIAKQIDVKLEPHIITQRDFSNRWLSFPAQIKKYGKKI